jgi:hypothetical protein
MATKVTKIVVRDGSGTKTAIQHTGHGAPPGKDVPHKTLPPMSDRASAGAPPQAASAKASASGRGTTGHILSNNWGAQSLRKVSDPTPTAPKRLGDMYAQANTLASSRFDQPSGTSTRQNPPAGLGNPGAPRQQS